MLKRLFASALLGGLFLVGTSSAALAGGHPYRHGYDKGYRHGYHEGYERGYRRGYRAGYRDEDYYYSSYYYYRPYPYYGPRTCGYGGAPANVVVVRCYAFQPRHIHIPVGAAAVWSFQDYGVAHTVTADNGSVDSGPRRDGEFRLVFDHPGEFRYHCAIHPYMVGLVSVG
jgi:plastocyanin